MKQLFEKCTFVSKTYEAQRFSNFERDASRHNEEQFLVSSIKYEINLYIYELGEYSVPFFDNVDARNWLWLAEIEDEIKRLGYLKRNIETFIESHDRNERDDSESPARGAVSPTYAISPEPDSPTYAMGRKKTPRPHNNL